MHNYLVCAYKSQEFAQSQNFFALLHNHETVTFRNSANRLTLQMTDPTKLHQEKIPFIIVYQKDTSSIPHPRVRHRISYGNHYFCCMDKKRSVTKMLCVEDHTRLNVHCYLYDSPFYTGSITNCC